MISLTPSTTAQDTNGVFALLKLIADPEAAKKRLEELAATASTVAEAHKQAAEIKASIAQDAAMLDLNKEEHEASVSTAAASLTQRETAVSARELSVSTREHAATKKETELADAQRNAEKDIMARQAKADEVISGKVQEHARTVAAVDEEHTTRKAELEAREEDISRREDAIAQREQEAATAKQQAEELKNSLRARIEKLKSAVAEG